MTPCFISTCRLSPFEAWIINNSYSNSLVGYIVYHKKTALSTLIFFLFNWYFSNNKYISSNKIKIAKSSRDIKEFIKQELNKKSSNSKLYLGKINDITSNRIKILTGLDLKNYNISLKGDNVRKIIKDHGNKILENLRGQDAITLKDFERIDNIILEADNIYISGKTKHNKDVIAFEKELNNKYTLIEFVSTKRKTLETQTMYKKIKKNSVTVDNTTNSPYPNVRDEQWFEFLVW